MCSGKQRSNKESYSCSTLETIVAVPVILSLCVPAESLCEAQNTQCDKERSTCTDSSGNAYCQCRQGYYKHNSDDLSCIGELFFY